MTWTRLRNGFKYIYEGADYYFGPSMRPVSARLSQITFAIYECQPVKHFRQGFSQLSRLPEFLHIGTQTRSLALRAVNTNITNYLVPIVMFRRGMNILYEKSPDTLDTVLNVIDWGVTFTILLRLYLRRIVHNAAHCAAYPRVIEKDIEKHLPFTLATQLAKELSEMFDKLFLGSARVESTFRENLFPELHTLFSLFFKQKDIEAKSFGELLKPLSKIFRSVIGRHDFVSADELFIRDFSERLALIVLKEIARSFEMLDKSAEKLAHDKMLEVLTRSFHKELAAERVTELERRIVAVKTSIQSFLPVVYHPACGCKDLMREPTTGLNTPEYYKRIIHAGISSTFYYAGNIAFTYLPNLLHWRNVITPNEFFYTKMIAFLIRVLIAGNAQNELKAAKRSQCTFHRYRIFARNKAHGFGVGAVQVLGAELLAQFVSLTMGVDDFFTRDALNQLMSQMNSITTLAYNDPLPGTKKDAWNWFHLPQQVTRWTVTQLTWLFMPDPREPKANDELLEKIRNIANSKLLHTGVRLIMGPGDLIPVELSAPILRRAKKGVELDTRGEGTLIHESKAPLSLILQAREDDALIILFNDECIRFVLRLYHEDITSTVATITKIQNISMWIAGPILALPVPIPAALASLIVIPLRILRQESLTGLFEKIQKELTRIQMDAAEAQIKEVDELKERVRLLPPSKKEVSALKIPAAPVGLKKSIGRTEPDDVTPDHYDRKVEVITSRQELKKLGSEENQDRLLVHTTSARRSPVLVSSHSLINAMPVVPTISKRPTTSVDRRVEQDDGFEMVEVPSDQPSVISGLYQYGQWKSSALSSLRKGIEAVTAQKPINKPSTTSSGDIELRSYR